MDISPYVSYDFGICFIAFCKRAVFLEMAPMKDIYDTQDVFVLLTDAKG